ncbi:MAG TPA: type VII secretion target [Pilimelia sp.]|nr:type VII secretion target [Pilimelia sp.]
MSLRVEPAGLDAYAAQLDGAAGDARQARQYLGQFADFGTGWGDLWELARQAHNRALGVVTAALDRTAQQLDASGKELTAAAHYYRTADAAAARRMDAALPGVCVRQDTTLAQAWASSPCPPWYADTREPVSHLRSVDDVTYSHPLGWMDALSISHWALEAFDAVFGFNPLARIQEFFMGDWQALARAGVAIGRVGDAVFDVGYNVQGGAVALRADWTGAAADNAQNHFVGLADDLAAMKGRLQAIAKEYGQIAHAIWSTCEGLGGLAKAMLDAAIIAGIAAVAGTVTAKTGVGAVVGYGVAALEVVEMLRLWSAATGLMQAAYSSLQAATGLILRLASDLESASLPAASGGAGYDHPLVAG